MKSGADIMYEALKAGKKISDPDVQAKLKALLDPKNPDAKGGQE